MILVEKGEKKKEITGFRPALGKGSPEASDSGGSQEDVFYDGSTVALFEQLVTGADWASQKRNNAEMSARSILCVCIIFRCRPRPIWD